MATAVAPFRSPELRTRFFEMYDRMRGLWPVPLEEVDVATPFGPTHVLVSGPAGAPPLVLLHGFNGTGLMWLTHIADLSQTYRCYSVETIGDVGNSVPERPIKSIADYVVWFRAVLDGLGLGEVRLAGLSYGGFLAANFARHAPERVSRLVLLGPAATLAPITPEFFWRAMPCLLLRSKTLSRWYWRWFLYHKELIAHPATELFVEGFQGYALPRDFVRPAELADDDLRQISVPTTVLIGDHEVIYRPGPEAALRRAEALIPNVRTYLIPGASHAQTLDNPAEVSRRMLEGLE